MDNSILIGGLIVILWGLGVWKAAELWSPPFLFEESKPTPKVAKPGSILPKLFWFCNGLLLIAVLTRMTLPKEIFRPIWMSTLVLGEVGLLALSIHLENTANATRSLIRLSAIGYEGVLFWTRASWTSEKPILIFCAILLFVGSGILTFFNEDFKHLTLFGLNLLICLFAICRYTTLAVKKDGVTIYRWLDTFPTTKISNTDIASIRIDKPILHRVFGVSRLTLAKVRGNHLSVALKDPMKIKKYIEDITANSASNQKTKSK
jgi:hypothetical protein